MHCVLALAAFVLALASSARWDNPDQRVVANADAGATPRVAATPVDRRDVVVHAQAVYRTRRYGEAEEALRCAGFRNIGPTRQGQLAAGEDDEVVPHPAVRHAAEADLPRHGSGARLCAHLQQAPVHDWYRERFRI